MIDQAYTQGAIDPSKESTKDQNWDVELSRKIFALDLGPIVNGIAYFSSTVFMEEVVVLSIVGFHFLLFKKNLNLTIAYVTCFVMNLIMTVITKKAIGKQRPHLRNIAQTSKSTFFRLKQNSYASNPSGDTVQSTNLVVFAALCLPSWAFWTVFPLGIMVPMSRVYLCCHWVSDTLWGALFSSILTFGTVSALREFTTLGV
jgi:membrane-associated phospholipid phosphatase